MKSLARLVVLGVFVSGLAAAPLSWAESGQELYKKGLQAYSDGKIDQAVTYFKEATRSDDTLTDAYFNLGAIFYNQKRYTEAQEAYNILLQKDPGDQAARYELGRVLDKLGKTPEAIQAFEQIPAAAPRYAKAQEHIARLKQAANPTVSVEVQPPKTETPTQTPSKTPEAPAQAQNNKPASEPPAVTNIDANKSKETPAPRKAVVQEFAKGFYGPTGVAVDGEGVLYVANFSKNTIYRVTPSGEKKLLAAGKGINGPVGLSLDHKTGDLYIANHLDNSIARIAPDGKVTVVATGLKGPYNLFLDEANRALYVTQQETNSIAKVQL